MVDNFVSQSTHFRARIRAANLATAYASTGDMEQAIQALKNAIDVSKTWENGPGEDWYSRAEERLQEYQQGRRSPE